MQITEDRAQSRLRRTMEHKSSHGQIPWNDDDSRASVGLER